MLCLATVLPDDYIGVGCGQCAVTNGLHRRGFRAISYEYKRDNICEDILSAPGFAYAISLIMRLTPGSVVWFQGIPCVGSDSVYFPNYACMEGARIWFLDEFPCDSGLMVVGPGA